MRWVHPTVLVRCWARRTVGLSAQVTAVPQTFGDNVKGLL